MPIEDRTREYLEQSIDVAVRCGYGSERRVLERVEEQVRDELAYGSAKLEGAQLDAEVERFLQKTRNELVAHRQLEQTWTERTVNDCIDAAFAALEDEGIVALQDAGYTMSDGWSDVHEARDEVDGAWGAVFFHRQDVERGVEGGGLMLAFGAFADGDTHEAESLRLAARACEVLGAHGVDTQWSGSIKARVEIKPFEWRKRRWTTAPR